MLLASWLSRRSPHGDPATHKLEHEMNSTGSPSTLLGACFFSRPEDSIFLFFGGGGGGGGGLLIVGK